MSTTASSLSASITSLGSKVASMSSELGTQTTNTGLLITLQDVQATLAYISNEQVLQTATKSQVVESASMAMAQASATISEIHKELNQYGGETPDISGNLSFLIVFAVLLVVHVSMGWFYKQWWILVAFFCGAGLELAGFIGRFLSHYDDTVKDYFLLQIIALTIAPAFIMGGIYNLLGKFIVVYGESYALMAPILYSYVFMLCDVVSLVVQAAGGAIAASATTDSENKIGTHIMVAGLAFQVLSMSVYVFLFTHFFHKIKFLSKSKHEAMEYDFNPKYKELRSRKIFQWFPYIVALCVALVYIRCVYRVVELAQGWHGYLITHEIYLFFLDAMLMAMTLAILVVFHPGVIFDGRNLDIQLVERKPKQIKNQRDFETELEQLESKREDGNDFDETTESFNGLFTNEHNRNNSNNDSELGEGGVGGYGHGKRYLM